MNTVAIAEIREVMAAMHYRPAVSIIMPFEPKMNQKEELMRMLDTAADKVKNELQKNYPDETCLLVMHKLSTVIKNLNFNTHKKSIAVYISPVFEKVLYLDLTVEEKIIVDESFEIRDLVYSKKQLHKYLVLVLSSKASRIYVGNCANFSLLVSNTPRTAYEFINGIAERVANFSDKSKRKEIIMERFLYQMDKSLDIILQAYPLPLFVLGTERLTGHFKKLTNHTGAVIEYIKGNYEEATVPELENILGPHIHDWEKVNQKKLLNQLEEAAGNKKLSSGMKDVWHTAMNKKGRLLVVEKNFMYAAKHGSSGDVIYPAAKPYNKFSYIKDAVDDVIEKVLEHGGDVEFTDAGILKNYQHIALIQ